MKTELRTMLASNLNPVFFGLACLLLASVFWSAKVMAEEIGALHDQAEYYYGMPSRHLWLAGKQGLDSL